MLVCNSNETIGSTTDAVGFPHPYKVPVGPGKPWKKQYTW